ncbi:MAG TPA: hypothetical protein VKQ72_10615 [Aggregatilineales bacterium]|nr:hypothetical protein [Aggregatilineales bacterium]
MPITLEFSENGYVAHYVFNGTWNASELLPLYEREGAHRKSVSHVVHTLIDILKMANIPPNAITASRKSPTFSSKNDGQLVIVGAKGYARNLAELICKLTHYTKVKFADGEDEAWTYLRALIPADPAHNAQSEAESAPARI